MNNFWDNMYDRFKDRRYGALFLSAILAFFGLLTGCAIIAAILRDLGLEDYFLETLPGIGILGLAWGYAKIRQARIRSQEKLPHDSLSRDELRVARSKLRNGMRPMQRPAPRVPDTNLKY